MTTQTKPTFRHNFKQPLDVKDIAMVNGYTKCLRALLNFLEEETNFNPDKRYIDSVQLLDRITNTNDELGELLSQELTNLKDDLAGVL